MSESEGRFTDWRHRLAMLRAVVDGFDDLPSHEKVGRLLTLSDNPSDLCEVLADIDPERREWWLRVCATTESRFYEGFTKMFETWRAEETGDE